MVRFYIISHHGFIIYADRRSDETDFIPSTTDAGGNDGHMTVSILFSLAAFLTLSNLDKPSFRNGAP